MNKIKLLLIAVILVLSNTSCNEDEPIKMLWEISRMETVNVDASVHYEYYSPVWVFAGGEAGQATLKCTNCNTLSIYGPKNEFDEYIDTDCRFTAVVEDANTVVIKFDPMDDDFEEVSCYLQVDGNTDGNWRSTMITIARIPAK